MPGWRWARLRRRGEAARRAAHPAKPSFALGFLTGQEMDWLPEAMRVLHDELPNLEVTVSSQYSPGLAEALVRGRLDLAFLRPEPQHPELAFRLVAREPIVAVFGARSSPGIAPAHRVVGRCRRGFYWRVGDCPRPEIVIDAYLKRSGFAITPAHAVDNLAMAISLVASTRGVALLPRYAEKFLPSSVISRPLQGDTPTIDLVIGYHTANRSPILKLFLSRVDALIARVSAQN